MLDRILFSLCPRVLSCFAGVLFNCMPWSFSGKRWLLTCMQHAKRLTRMQHTKHYSCTSYCHAAHELILACSTRNIARVCRKVYSPTSHFMSHVCSDCVMTKIEEHTHVHRTRVSTWTWAVLYHSTVICLTHLPWLHYIYIYIMITNHYYSFLWLLVRFFVKERY